MIKTWIKRYLILTICLSLVLLPLLHIFNEFDVFKDDIGRLISLIVISVVVVIFYTVMTIIMIKGEKNKIERK